MELVNSKRQVVLFATPAFESGVSVDFLVSMMDTQMICANNGIAFDFQIRVGNQFIDVVRNNLVDYFLKAPANFTDLIFIDSDQGWDANVIPRILGYSQGVVAALPPKKAETESFHDNYILHAIENSLFQAKEAGTGFMRIKREVFEAMDKAYPELAQMVEPKMGWPTTPYFQRGNTKYGGFLGEDIFFCRQLTQMGEYIWIDSDVTFTHRGSKAWKGNFYDYAVRSGKLRKAS